MIICCGEALIDMLPRQLGDGSDVYLPVPGGAIFNTAIALGRLGSPAAFFSRISTDMFGEQLIAALEASHVDASLCLRADQPTTLAFVTLKDGQARYSFMDENSAGRMLDVTMLPALPAEAVALHFGAISLIPEPCGHAYETFMARHFSKAVLSFDPNIRPGFISDPRAHRARMQRMLAHADIVKISDEDLEWLAPDQPAESVVNEWLNAGRALVIVTQGSKGATAYTRRFSVAAPAIQVDVVDTIGAGDTFNAGVLSALSKADLLEKQRLQSLSEQDVKITLNFACKVAAITVSRTGANPPWAHEMTEPVQTVPPA